MKQDISILTLANCVENCKRQRLIIGLGTVHIPLQDAERLLLIFEQQNIEIRRLRNMIPKGLCATCNYNRASCGVNVSYSDCDKWQLREMEDK